MRVFGITGGVGAGKSAILKYIEEKYKAKVILADDVANFLKEPGQSCYQPIIDLLGEDILEDEEVSLGEGRKISRFKMAEVIFADTNLLAKVNDLIHPAVKAEIKREIKEADESGKYEYCFVEAALLIEDHYDAFLEEIWYIHTEPDVRRERLKEHRGYSDEKINQIMNRQMSKEEFMEHCSQCIDNSGTKEEAFEQIDQLLKK